MSRQVLVTGGAGFIGSHLVEALVGRGLGVRVLDDLSSGTTDNLASVRSQVELVVGSVADANTVMAAAYGCDAVFHLAAIASVVEAQREPRHAHDVNATGTLNVIEAARAVGARVVYSSSAAVYGNDPTLPKTEALPTYPISHYGAQKLLGEGYLRSAHLAFGLQGVALRYFNVFGPRQNPSSPYSGVISIFVDRAAKGMPLTIYGDGSQTRDFVYVSDVVAANLAAYDAPAPGFMLCNVGGGHETSVSVLAKSVVDLLESRSETVYAPARPSDILRSVSDPSRAERALGWKTKVAFKDGLAKTLAATKRPAPSRRLAPKTQAVVRISDADPE